MRVRLQFPWPFPPWNPNRNDTDDEILPDPDPVLLIPGIGGSILNAVSDDGKKSERIWVRLLNADKEFRTKLWSKYNPETGKTESLDAKSHIEVPQDNYGLYAVDKLDPDVKFNLAVVNYFHEMIEAMHGWGFVDGTSLFGFGYDFRQSNRLPATLDALREKLASIHDTTGKKVNVVTHSMGGVLFKCFLALHPEEVERYVQSWVAIACPFRGAPGFILDTLLTGVEFLKGWQKGLFVAKWSMHQLLVECPSVWELMAHYEYSWQEVPELRLVQTVQNRNMEGEAEVREVALTEPEKIVRVLKSALQDNAVVVGGETIALPLNMDIVQWADETRRILETAKLPVGVKFFSIYGTGMDTAFHARYGSQESPLELLQDILQTEVEFENVNGDGTVPLESALGDGLDASFRIGVPGEHRGLLSDDRCLRLVKFFLGVDPDPLYDPVTDCVLVPAGGLLPGESPEEEEECIRQMAEALMEGDALAEEKGQPPPALLSVAVTCTEEEPDEEAKCYATVEVDVPSTA
eukprot:TRINITY_DN38652_c0_g1_i1.p1 TRINITY_DN38652_c0_g1~~TRINITY_DN38652_c0_g1_i1.p1  ORF type:complete len:521 (-),score=105.23 TRINITY_DN38652_c0_g1_i1:1212-2774(-)